VSVTTSAGPELAPVLDFVTARTGLAFSSSRIEGAEAWITASMERAGIGDPAGLLTRLAGDPAALDDLVDGLTIGETYFYREPEVFVFLRREFLPRMRRERDDRHVLRVWSAGCATGEEAYSLAILLEEEGWGGRSVVIGSDISRAALRKAQRAAYGTWAFRGTDESFVRRHFSREGATLILSDPIRDRVRFEHHNLAADPCPALATGSGGVDLILCRNVLIYFVPAAVERLAGVLHDALNEGGMLVTGSADPPLHRFAALGVVPSDAGIMYTRRRIEAARPPDAAAAAAPSAARGAPGRIVPPAAGSPSAVRPKPASAGEPEDGAAFAARVRAVASAEGSAAAVAEAERGSRRYPLSLELSFLRSVLLAGEGRYAEAAAAARGTLRLDSSLAASHFVLASALWNCGDLDGARRAFSAARDLASARPTTEPVPFSERETYGGLATGAAAKLGLLNVNGAVRS